MITKAQAVKATHRQEFFHGSARTAQGNFPAKARVNGKCKTWVTRPNEFRLPMKYGLDDCFYITEQNAEIWFATPTGAMAYKASNKS
jgi:hypothetical protein